MKVWLIGVYDLTLPRGKSSFLSSLQKLREIMGEGSWILAGDFNMIKDLGEKKGGVCRLDPISHSFQETIQDKRS